MKKRLSKIIYYMVAINLPKSNSRISLFSKKIRRYLARNIIKSMGNNVNVEKGAVFGENISIGDNSGIGVNCTIMDHVKIGDNVMMGPEVTIYTRNHCTRFKDIPMREQGFEEYKEVIIGNDVWIGSRVIILPGVIVGDGAVIGAGAVVTKKIEPYTINAGNPCKKVKERFESE